MSRRFGVVGAGGWGTAMACHLAKKGLDVAMWGHDGRYADEMHRLRSNPKYLPGVTFPESLLVSSDPVVLAKADVLLSGVPTRYVRDIFTAIAPALPKKSPVVSLTKGIENETLVRPTEILREVAPGRLIAVLSGPSHAEEVVKGKPTVVTIAAGSAALAKRLQQEFTTEFFRCYTNSDVVGVELAGAVKNVIAIAAGIVDGLGLGDNTKAALLTRGLAETVALGMAMGARRRTFYGIAGIGDLMTTAFSPFGRNRAVGERLGKGESLEKILGGMAMVAEGVASTRSVVALAKRHEVEMPICREVHRVLFEGKDPKKGLIDLMTRRPKNE